jgi:hypothetical protein
MKLIQEKPKINLNLKKSTEHDPHQRPTIVLKV